MEAVKSLDSCKLEHFSVDYSVEGNLCLLWLYLTSPCDWLKNLAQFSHPIRSKTKTDRDLVAGVFPRLAPITRFRFEFSLVFNG